MMALNTLIEYVKKEKIGMGINCKSKTKVYTKVLYI